MIRPNETNVVYPKVNETLAVWFGQYNATAADIGVPDAGTGAQDPRPQRQDDAHRRRADGTAGRRALLSKVTCASFTVEQASPTSWWCRPPASRRQASTCRRPALAEEGERPCGRAT